MIHTANSELNTHAQHAHTHTSVENHLRMSRSDGRGVGGGQRREGQGNVDMTLADCKKEEKANEKGDRSRVCMTQIFIVLPQ